jgi:putative tricarboxylic transport membrane protein
MRLNDAILGSVFLGMALLVLWNIRALPTIPGQDIGPGAFPGLLAALLIVCSALLIQRGIRNRAQQKWFEAGAWMRSAPHLRHFALVVGGLAFYILFAQRLGFFACAILILVALFLSLQVRLTTAVPLALAAALVVHTIFYKGLKVPLPWGLLPVLW